MSTTTSEPHSAHKHGISHVMSPAMLVGVFAALIVLTGLTVGVTLVDFGPAANLVIALAIATVKAGLVAAFFMHLLYDNRLNLLFFLGSFAFLFLFISITLMDSFETRPLIEARVQALDAATTD